MPNATPPAPPRNHDDDDDLFDLSRLVSTALPPPMDPDLPEDMVIPGAPPPREPLDSVRVAALPKKRPWTKRALSAGAAFAVGALVALGVAKTDANDETVATIAAPTAIAPESTPRPAAAPTIAVIHDEAPVHIAVAEESEAPTAEPTRVGDDEAREETAAPPVAEEATADPAEEAAIEEAPAEEAQPIEEAQPAAEEPAPFDSRQASMGQLLDHAVADLDQLSLPTHDPEAAPAPEAPAAEEPAAPTGPGRDDVQRVMESLRPAIAECAAGGHGLTYLQLNVTPAGRALAPRVSGPFAGSPEGSCMARAARTATFPAFDGDEAVTLRYPYRL